MVYLDNAATTFPKPESVYVAMDEVNRNMGVNAGRGSYSVAREVSSLISETKDAIRKLVHADSTSAVVFSPSITIALNQIINGIDWQDGAAVYVSPYEHNAVARTIYSVSKQHNLKIVQIPIDKESLEIDIDKLKYDFSKEKPFAVFCTHVSNVTGYILPVKEIFEEAKKYNAYTILDSAQSLGLIDVNVNQIDVDVVAFAGHKCLYGPFGIGGFVNVSGFQIKEFITGGTGSDSLNLNMPSGAETKYEAASCNIVAIAGLNAAIKEINIIKCFEHEKELTSYLIEKLRELKNIKLYLPRNLENHIGIVPFTVDGMSSEDVGMILDEDFDIAVRTGYHCAPYIHEYLDDMSSLGTIRVGIGQFNSIGDVDKLVCGLKDVIS